MATGIQALRQQGIEAPRPVLLSRKALAKYLGLCDRTVDRLVASGELPAPRRGSTGGKRWLREEVDEAIRHWPVVGDEARH